MDMLRTPVIAAVVVTLVVVVVFVAVGEEAKWVTRLMMLCEVACGWEDWGLKEAPVLAK
jgi:hypothetical protein